MVQTPVFILIFNRPDTFEKLLAQLRIVQPTRLYIVADGHRSYREGEDVKCRNTRALVNTIDWECEIKTLFFDENKGNTYVLYHGINWLFEHEERMIFFEDDNVPDVTFFPFCEELLERYKDDHRIMHINGSSFIDFSEDNPDSYYFSRFLSIWGFATWKRAWEKFQLDAIIKDSDKTYEEVIRFASLNLFDRMYIQQIFNYHRKGKEKVFDQRWMYHVWKYKGLGITPTSNLNSNIGVGHVEAYSDGSLTKIQKIANLPTKSIHKITHPVKVEVNDKLDKKNLELVNHYRNPKYLAYHFYKKIVKS